MNFTNMLSSAGQLACSFDKKRVSYAGEGSGLVSDIDEAISVFVHDVLMADGFFKEGGCLLDEERAKGVTPAVIKAASDVFVIDPIDGSGAAVEGRPEFCVQMARYRREDGVLRAVWSGFYRPRTLEMCVSGPEGVTYTSYQGVPGLHNERQGSACLSDDEQRLMLMDYRFYERFRWTARVPMVHMNPSGFNMGDIALNRGLGFVFEYKPWDVCLLPLAGALGCRAYLLKEGGDIFEAEEVDPVVFEPDWFDWNSGENVFGKMRQPLLVCRPENLRVIMKNLFPAK